MLFLFIEIPSEAAVLWNQNFDAIPGNFYTTSGMTRNAGSTYACVFGNYLYYTSSTYAYVETNTINVPQGRGINLTFDSRRNNSSAGTVQVYYLVTGSCSWDRLNPNNNGWVLWGTITPNTSIASPGGCTTQTLSLQSHVCGGQNIAVLLYFPNASSTNWIAIDNLVIDDLGPTGSAVPNISGATTYTENFTVNRWYGPVTTGNYSTTGVYVPYHSYRSSSTAYTYLWNNGCNGTGNHTGVWADYFAAFYTGFEFCNASGSSQIITRELNTSSCPAAELKFAYMAKYPCTAGNYDYTSDESYSLWAPKVYVSSGQGYTWVQLPVNYYFPDGLWHFASYQLPSAANIKIRMMRGGSCSNPVEGVDHIKVLCRDCSISTLSGGTITGPPYQLPNIDYNFSITPTVGATYYKWMVRAIASDPPIVYSNPCPDGGNPCIVSGQGTTDVVINFGSNPANYRVMCIPFDANPGTLVNPTDACYAKISIYTAVLPVELTYFIMEAPENLPILKWQTASELNNDRFEILRSSDGIVFEFLSALPGGGSTNQALNYEWTDGHPLIGMSYYKLVQYDFDGTMKELGVLGFINEMPELESEIYFAEQNLHILSGLSGEMVIKIFDINGKEVFSQMVFVQEGTEQTIAIPQLTTGIYSAALIQPNENRISTKFSIQ